MSTIIEGFKWSSRTIVHHCCVSFFPQNLARETRPAFRWESWTWSETGVLSFDIIYLYVGSLSTFNLVCCSFLDRECCRGRGAPSRGRTEREGARVYWTVFADRETREDRVARCGTAMSTIIEGFKLAHGPHVPTSYGARRRRCTGWARSSLLQRGRGRAEWHGGGVGTIEQQSKEMRLLSFRSAKPIRLAEASCRVTRRRCCGSNDFGQTGRGVVQSDKEALLWFQQFESIF